MPRRRSASECAADGRAAPDIRARVAVSAVQKLVAVALVPMVAVTLWLALTSDHLGRPGGRRGVLGLPRRSLDGDRPTGGVAGRRAASGHSWSPSGSSCGSSHGRAADLPLAFDIGVLAEAPFFVLTFYLFLAFPMGRLDAVGALAHVVLVFGVVGFFLPGRCSRP